MAKMRVFISFDYDNDKHYKNLLVAWDKNDLFNFSFYDGSVTVPVNSTDAGPIRHVISQRIADCPRFLCIVCKDTHKKSSWVKWEIDKAVELKRKIMPRQDRPIEHDADESAECWGIMGALSFTFDAIKKALKDALAA